MVTLRGRASDLFAVRFGCTGTDPMSEYSPQAPLLWCVDFERILIFRHKWRVDKVTKVHQTAFALASERMDVLVHVQRCGFSTQPRFSAVVQSGLASVRGDRGTETRSSALPPLAMIGTGPFECGSENPELVP